MLVRLQKFLADAGVASRRACESIIEEGRVQVNGQVVSTLGAKVDPLHDAVLLDGRRLKSKKKQYLALNKPKGMICSNDDPEGRPSIFELLPAEWAGLHSVGRLDFNSEGLIFITNDGDFSLKLTHPRYEVAKVYHVVVRGSVSPEELRSFIKGVFHEGEMLKAEKTRLLRDGGNRCIVELILKEGKNREVRRMFESIGKTVERLVRVQIGRIRLAELPTGRWRTLTEAEIRSLLPVKS